MIVTLTDRMQSIEFTEHTTPQGTPYTVRKRDAYGAVTVTVGGKAAKGVKQDATGNRWRSLDGQTFATLDEVADSMRWAL